MKDMIVQLIRRFVPTSSGLGDWEFLSPTPIGPAKGWHEILDDHRALIIAAAGAGKTFEALDCARKLHAKGRKAFFIRIEAIDMAFDTAFEVGTTQEFASWLASGQEAWFFLDSVDEAQLETPRALEDAIRIFGERIHDARGRAHIFITSREEAWQALSDRTLVDQYLPFGAPEAEGSEDTEPSSSKSSLKVFRLDGLNHDEIALFATHFGVGDATAFVDALKRADLLSLAERPFDLKALITNWLAGHPLGGRLDTLRRMIDAHIAPLSARDTPVLLDGQKVRDGVRALAAAVTLTGQTIICMPDGVHSPDRLDPAEVLPDWSEAEIDSLLRCGLFDDIVYGSVRVRHREIRELLTAEWANDLLGRPARRTDVEALFFRTKYGEEILVPRLRPALSWLILMDETVRTRALAIEPEIASEGGDPSQLPLDVRRAMLADIVKRIAADEDE